MYCQNPFYCMVNHDYIRQLTEQRYVQQQNINVIECINKCNDFLNSIDKIAPEYQAIAASGCAIELAKYWNRHSR